MSKRARHQPGFYASLLNDVCDRDFGSKYRPKQKPVVMNISFSGKITLQLRTRQEPAEHLAEGLVAAFEKRSVDPVRADE